MTISELPIADTYSYWVFTGSDCARFEPKLDSDEWLGNLEWLPSKCSELMPNFIWRRRIDPGAGFELVPLDELESSDMDFTRNGTKWESNRHYSIKHGRTVRGFLEGCRRCIDPILAFRRKSAPKVESVDGWISVKDRLPELGQDVWVFLRGEVIQWQNTNSRYWDKDAITHWQPFIKPAPPKPEPSADEVAFEKWWIESSGKKDWISSKCDCLDSWQAALAYARKDGGK